MKGLNKSPVPDWTQADVVFMMLHSKALNNKNMSTCTNTQSQIDVVAQIPHVYIISIKLDFTSYDSADDD